MLPNGPLVVRQPLRDKVCCVRERLSLEPVPKPQTERTILPERFGIVTKLEYLIPCRVARNNGYRSECCLVSGQAAGWEICAEQCVRCVKGDNRNAMLCVTGHDMARK